MATKKNSRRYKKRCKKKYRSVKRFLTITAIVILAILGFFYGKDFLDKPAPTVVPVSGNEVQFHFIDVGQADAALVRTASGDILIDAGMGESEEALQAYLDQLGISVIEYAIFTHPHEDHIGGADMILENYEIKRVVMPDVAEDTVTYFRMMNAIEAEGCEVILSRPEETFRIGELICTILAPLGDSYEDLNDYSITLRVDYGETSVLFTGDAEKVSEDEMLERYGDSFGGMLDCDLIKVGHHGSSSSSTQKFLNAVTPDVAVISCGKGNKHGHPTQSVLKRYEAMDILLYRTDLEGSIVFISTGGEPVKQ
jgi:competence protein ComEC